ncbi:FAD-dependent monooxygenase [Metabacillus sp. JX24]|uniref:FAD-dependent monooxygenase n=1 Tax=Metabacillus sp. JX24 TaxID=3240759 RepID=UPI00350F4C84
MDKNSTLIVGAGPTGLILAISLAKQNIPFRIIDKKSGPGNASRALVVHARTLEFYRQLGLSDVVVDRGFIMNGVHIYENKKEKAYLKIEELGEGLSPFPYMLILPQDEHEQLLTQILSKMNIHIEWETELISFKDTGDVIEAVLSNGNIVENNTFAYICGCDGAKSSVRKQAGFEFLGETHEEAFFVADVEFSGMNVSNHEFYAFFNDEGFCAFIPVRKTGIRRLLGLIPSSLDKEGTGFDELRPFIEKQTGLEIIRADWFSTYKVHHLVSNKFQSGRVFICGDAGHIHSPVGGQGMNTGIGDAINLSWKIAAVLKGKASIDILDTYETERIAFAKKLVATTDQSFKRFVGRNSQNPFLLNLFLPYVVPFLLEFPITKKRAFNMLSQNRVNYRDSEISRGKAGKLRGGDRLPWIEGENNNFDPLKSLDWQIHVYGTIHSNLKELADYRNITINCFEWTPTMRESGIEKDAAYLIRPDGYISVATPDQDSGEIEEFLELYKINPGNEN